MRRMVPLLAAALLSLFSVACGTGRPGGSPTATHIPTPTTTPEASVILSQARAAMAEVQSYRFALEIGDEAPERNLGKQPLERVATWAAPSRWLVTVDGKDAMLVIDGEMYIKNGNEGPGAPWRGTFPANRYPGFVPHGPLLHLADPALLGEEVVDGEAVYRIGGQNEPDDPEAHFGAVAQVELLIRKSDHLPAQMVIKDFSHGVKAGPPGTTPEPIPPRPEDAATYRYYDFNTPVTVEPPAIWETGPAPTATPGQAFSATLGFRPTPEQLTDEQWRELVEAVTALLREADEDATVRVFDGMLMIDAPYPRERAEGVTRLVESATLPFPLTLRAQSYSARGS